MNHLDLVKNLEPEQLDNKKFWFANIFLFAGVVGCIYFTWALLIPTILIWSLLIFKSVKWAELQKRNM